MASPNGTIVVSVAAGSDLRWSVDVAGKPVLLPSSIGLTLDAGRVVGALPKVRATTTRTVDQVLRPVVRVKRAEVRDRFNERRIDFAGDYSLIVRAYDDGVAYRFVTKIAGDIEVRAEDASFKFAGDHRLYFPEEDSFLSHQERSYKRLRIAEVGTRFSSLPAIVETDGPKIAITEADLFDYPGMDLTGGSEPNSLKGLFPYYPAKVELGRDRDEKVVERESYMAKTAGTREFPWRVLVVAAADTTLLDTDIVYRLASESRIGDTSWIRPGKVAWDWWNFNNVYGVPFRAGVNTDTYKHYIDFAAENGIEYVILDEGWYKLGDLMTQMPGIDMEAIAAYARQKKVGLVMWVIWKTLDLQMAQALDQFEKWGVKGIKVDFMQREDQWMVNYYERVAREAAKRHLLVDFHGAYKPTGLYRTYPNVVTSEGVLGLEQSKWGDAGVARQRRHVPVHADDGGAGGLHARRDDERDEGRLQADLQPADEPGHALSAVGDVCRLRESAADAGRLAVELPARGRRAWRSWRASPPSGTRRRCCRPRSASTSWWRGGAARPGTSVR